MSSFRDALLPCLFLSILFATNGNANEGLADQSLRSAYLGPDRWDADLTATGINRQLKDHFRKVLAVLESQCEASLTSAASQAGANATGVERATLVRTLRENREKQIARLREYMATGTFPLNEGQGERAVPIFVDRNGTHCAVGYLMHRDGWDAEVAEIVQSNNLVYIPEIRGGVFLDWVAQSGLTREEAALIQPAYAPPEFQVTLEEMQTTMPTLTREGYTVSGLTVDEYSYDGSTQLGPWITGRLFGYDLGSPSIVPYRAPADFGIHLNSGIFESSDYGVQWQNELDSWMFLGSREVDMGQPMPSGSAYENDAIMFRIGYSIESNGQPFNEFALTSNGNFNFNYLFDATDPSAELQVQTRLYSGTSPVSGNYNLIGEIEMQAGLDDGILNDIRTLEIEETQLYVETFAMAYKGASFTSLFHEFGVAADNVDGDFNDDGVYDCADIDAMMAAIAAGSDEMHFELTGDGIVNLDDRDAWLVEAGMALGFDGPIKLGDANLDGAVDVSDFNLFNENKFTSSTDWCKGEFNGDASIDASDFNIWNENKLTRSDMTQVVPEPGGAMLLFVGCVACAFMRKRR